MTKLTPSEKNLVKYAKRAVVEYNRLRHASGGIDTLYSFVMSDSGVIHDGVCLESSMSTGVICGERHAIANMVLKESYKAKIKTIIVADPVPSVQKKNTPPCGTCRHMIWEFGKPDAVVILMQYIQKKKGWMFPKIEKYQVKDFYPYPYDPIPGLWDNCSQK